MTVTKKRGRSVDAFYDPPWFTRFLELRRSGMTYHDCAKTLNEEGFKAVHGGKITIDTIRCRVHNRLQARGED